MDFDIIFKVDIIFEKEIIVIFLNGDNFDDEDILIY